MMRLTKVRKSLYFIGRASSSCLISFLESLRRAGAGNEFASAPVETFAPGEVATAPVDGPVGGAGAFLSVLSALSALSADLEAAASSLVWLPGDSTVSGFAPAEGIVGKVSAN